MPCGGARLQEGTDGAPAGVPFRGHVEGSSGASQDGQHTMHPVVTLGVAQPTGQAGHGLQGGGLLIDEKEKPLGFPRCQPAFGTTTSLSLAYGALPGCVQRITGGRGHDKRWQHAHKLVMGQSGRGEELSWSVFQSGVS